MNSLDFTDTYYRLMEDKMRQLEKVFEEKLWSGLWPDRFEEFVPVEGEDYE